MCQAGCLALRVLEWVARGPTFEVSVVDRLGVWWAFLVTKKADLFHEGAGDPLSNFK